MKLLQNLAVRLSVTRAELTVISLLLFFLLLGGVVRHALSAKKADALIRTLEAEKYSDAEVDSLLRLAPGLDATLEEDIQQGITGTEGGPAQTSGRSSQTVAKKIFTGTMAFNSASEKQLQKIPGIGPVMAQRLMKFRHAKGGKVQQFDDFLEVKGIGKKKLEVLKKHLTLE